MIPTTCPKCQRNDQLLPALANLPILCKSCGARVLIGEESQQASLNQRSSPILLQPSETGHLPFDSGELLLEPATPDDEDQDGFIDLEPLEPDVDTMPNFAQRQHERP